MGKSISTQQDRSSSSSTTANTETQNLLEDMDFKQRLTIVRILLDLGAPVNSKSETVEPALHLAVRNNCIEVAKLLLEYGANVDEVDKDKRTPLHLCAEFGDSKMAELLLKYYEHGLQEEVNVRKSHQIKQDFEYRWSRQLYNMGDELSGRPIFKWFTKEHLLHDLIFKQDDNCSCFSFLRNIQDDGLLDYFSVSDGWKTFWITYQKFKIAQFTKLHHSDNVQCIVKKLNGLLKQCIDTLMKCIIEHGSEMQTLENKATPLHLAVQYCCRSLIFNEFQLQLVNALSLDDIYEKLPIIFLGKGRENKLEKEVFKRLMDQVDGYRISSSRPFGRNSDDDGNQSKTLEMRENLAYYLNRKDSEGYDAIIKAVEFNRCDVVQLLLSNGADTCSITSQGYAALHIAVNCIHNVPKVSRPQEMLEVLLAPGKCNVNVLTYNAETPLHLAIRNCGCRLPKQDSEMIRHRREMQDGVISILLKNKANVNHQDCDGMTPLMIASENGCYHLVKMVITGKFTVDLDLRDKYGETALIKAARMRRTEIAAVLVNSGARIDIQDCRGFTALHAALHDPDDFRSLLAHFESLYQVSCPGNSEASEKVNSRFKDSFLISLNVERYDEKKTLIQILLSNERYFNTLDFESNTPLDFLVDSEIQCSRSEQEAQEQLDKIRKENYAFKEAQCQIGSRWFHLKRRRESPFFWLAALCIMIAEHDNSQPVDLKVEKIAKVRDIKERTVLHYAAILSGFDQLAVYKASVFKSLLMSGCKMDARDIHQRTPMHYLDVSNSGLLLATVEMIRTESSKQEQLIFKDILKMEDADDKTVEELQSLRKEYAERERIRKCDYNEAVKAEGIYLGFIRYDSREVCIGRCGSYNFKSGIPWSIWTKDIAAYAHRNTLTRCLTEEIDNFIQRLADAIERKEPCFKCKPMPVGSAIEGTKIDSPDEFDFDFILTIFNNLVEVIPSPVAPEGFVHLKKRPTIHLGKDEEMFFAKDGTLLTNEINSRFKIALSKVLRDSSFWNEEHLFELTDNEEAMKRFVRWFDRQKNATENSDLTDHRINPGICTTIRLKQTRSLEGQYLPNYISLDIVPCIHVDGWWPDKARSDIRDTFMAEGCNLVFDQPQRKYPWVPFGENYARISFAPAESQIIRDSSPMAKASYMVCKHLIKDKPQMTYVLKMCLLYCIEALGGEDERSHNKETNYNSMTAEKLSLWVEKLMRCYLMIFLQDFCPCYLMPSFCLSIGDFLKSNHILLHVTNEIDYKFLKEKNYQSYRCSFREVYIANFNLFRKVCTGEANIPLPKPHPLWESFTHDTFILQLRACFV